MNSVLRRTGSILLTLIFVLADAGSIAAAQGTAPRVLAYIQEVKDSPSLLVAFSSDQPGAYTMLAPRPDTHPFPMLSPNAQWMVTRTIDENGESYLYKPVGMPQGKTLATVRNSDESEKQEEQIDCCVFSDDSRYLLYLRILPFSAFSKKWSINIVELTTGVQTTFWTTDRRVRRRGFNGSEVMTELTEIIRVWRTADKRLLFRKYLRFDEADDYPQNIPTGFYVLDLSKFDLSKGGTFQMPQMMAFSTANFTTDPFSDPEFHPIVFTALPLIAPDRTQLAYTYGLYGVYVPMGIGILDLGTARFTEIPMGVDSPRSLRWTSDGKKLVLISAKPGFPNYFEYRDYRVNVLEAATGKILQSMLIDEDGKMRWFDALLCGDTLFMTAAIATPAEVPQVSILVSAQLGNPARFTQLFSATGITLERCA